MREMLVQLTFSENKFKKMGCDNWKTSKYMLVISSIRVQKYDLNEHKNCGLELINQMGLCASALQRTDHLYSMNSEVDLATQLNYYELKENNNDCDSRYVKQRTENWFELRSAAKVTGSTCYSAVGLDTLKRQQAHFDMIFNTQSERMRFGVLHEIDAIATLVSKVLPFLYPNAKYVEEGASRISNEDDEHFMVVSPDGSIRNDTESSPFMMYENKCKTPNDYSSSVYYNLPSYYISQVLAEMKIYDCSELLFTCWSPESMVVSRIEFDECLWNKIWNKLIRIYGSAEPKRPNRFSDAAKSLRVDIRTFAENKVKVLGEFPSVKSVSRPSQTPGCDGDSFFLSPRPECESRTLVKTETATTLARSLRNWFESSYDLLRTIATEILVFMVNDVDRMYKDEISNATPIAYAMKGPSMTTEIFRKMMGEVMSHCKNKGLNVVATAADGQWHKYGVRDSSDAPLTLFQLQRDFWKATMIMSKSDLLKKIRHVLTVKSLTDVLVERENNSLIVFGHAHDKRLIYSQELSSALLKSKNSISSDTLEEKLSPEQLGTDLAGVINDEVVGSLGEDDLAEVDEIISGRRSISLGVLQNKHDYDVETDPCIDVLFNDDMGERTIGTFDQTDHPHLISVEEAPPRSPENLLNPLCDENMECFTYHDTSNVSDQLPHIPECVEVLSDAFAVLYQDDIY